MSLIKPFTDNFSSESLIQALSLSGERYQPIISSLDRNQGSDQIFPILKALSAEARLISSSAQLTGYYLAEVRGSINESPDYPIPIYGLPRLIAQRSFTRIEIERDLNFHSHCPIVAWTDDPINLFFLHIQGSGILRLNDGSQRTLQFAGTNNQPYQSIGALLIESKSLTREQCSMQSIKKYLRADSERAKTLMQRNPRFTFFSLSNQAATGTANTTLVPFRSIASDWQHYPSGALLYIETTLPTFSQTGVKIGLKPVSFLALNHDTGGAIKGMDRIDLFTGSGQEVELLAGSLNQQASIWMFNFS